MKRSWDITSLLASLSTLPRGFQIEIKHDDTYHLAFPAKSNRPGRGILTSPTVAVYESERRSADRRIRVPQKLFFFQGGRVSLPLARWVGFPTPPLKRGRGSALYRRFELTVGCLSCRTTFTRIDFEIIGTIPPWEKRWGGSYPVYSTCRTGEWVRPNILRWEGRSGTYGELLVLGWLNGAIFG